MTPSLRPSLRQGVSWRALPEEQECAREVSSTSRRAMPRNSPAVFRGFVVRPPSLAAPKAQINEGQNRYPQQYGYDSHLSKGFEHGHVLSEADFLSDTTVPEATVSGSTLGSAGANPVPTPNDLKVIPDGAGSVA